MQQLRTGNAAGTCNRPGHFEKLLKSAADIIMIGPMSVPARAGNPGNNAYRDRYGNSINSMGLPNDGSKAIAPRLSGLIKQARDAGKDLAVTVPPIHDGDEERLATTCAEAGVPIVEVNVGCNHVFEDGKQKLPAGYFQEDLHRIVTVFVKIAGGVCRLRFKLVPYIPVVPPWVADIFRPYPEVELVLCNTAGNACMFREEDWEYAIEYGEHLGGYGGRGMKPIALGNMKQLRKMLPDHHLIGVSGIENGRDAWEYVKVGASWEIQIGTEWWFSENARIFAEVQAQFLEALEAHPI